MGRYVVEYACLAENIFPHLRGERIVSLKKSSERRSALEVSSLDIQRNLPNASKVNVSGIESGKPRNKGSRWRGRGQKPGGEGSREQRAVEAVHRCDRRTAAAGVPSCSLRNRGERCLSQC